MLDLGQSLSVHLLLVYLSPEYRAAIKKHLCLG